MMEFLIDSVSLGSCRALSDRSTLGQLVILLLSSPLHELTQKQARQLSNSLWIPLAPLPSI